MNRDDFAQWLAAQADEGERLLNDELGASPRWYFFEKGSSDYAHQFYKNVERWRCWRLSLITGLRRHLRHADHLVADAERRFADSNLLVFRLRDFNDSEVFQDVDLSHSAKHLDASGWIELRQWFQRSRKPEPDWNAVRQTLTTDIRSFKETLMAQLNDLDIVAVQTTGSESQPCQPPSETSRFVCTEKLGEGVFGEVWQADDTELGRPVAVKFIRSTGATRTEVLEHARAISRVSHPNIVVVYDVAPVWDPVTKAPLDAIVMELVEGQTLGEMLRTHLNAEDAKLVGFGLLEAIGEYHAKDLAHMDLHAGNVLIGNGNMRLLDPRFLDTGALRSTATKQSQQDRDLRSLRDLLTQILRATHLSFDAILEFERNTTSPTLAGMRIELSNTLESPFAPPPDGRDRNPTKKPEPSELLGIPNGPVLDAASAMVLALAREGQGDRRGHRLVPVNRLKEDLGLSSAQYDDGLAMLEDAGLLAKARMGKYVQLTQRGRHAAHVLGAEISSAVNDAEQLLALLANHGDGALRGHSELDDRFLSPALGVSRERLLEAGRLLRQRGDLQLRDLAQPDGRRLIMKLTPQGRHRQ